VVGFVEDVCEDAEHRMTGLEFDPLYGGYDNRPGLDIGLRLGHHLSEGLARHRDDHELPPRERLSKIAGGFDAGREFIFVQVAWIAAVAVDRLGDVFAARPNLYVMFSRGDHRKTGSETSCAKDRGGCTHARTLTLLRRTSGGQWGFVGVEPGAAFSLTFWGSKATFEVLYGNGDATWRRSPPLPFGRSLTCTSGCSLSAC
jgi:hypothetical protein